MNSPSAFTYVWDTATPPRGALAVAGALTHDSAGTLLESTDARLDGDTGIRALHVDCGGVTECDFPGLSALLALRRRADALHIALDISPVSATLTTLMERTGLDGYLCGTPVDGAAGGRCHQAW